MPLHAPRHTLSPRTLYCMRAVVMVAVAMVVAEREAVMAAMHHSSLEAAKAGAVVMVAVAMGAAEMGAAETEEVGLEEVERAVVVTVTVAVVTVAVVTALRLEVGR